MNRWELGRAQLAPLHSLASILYHKHVVAHVAWACLLTVKGICMETGSLHPGTHVLPLLILQLLFRFSAPSP